MHCPNCGNNVSNKAKFCDQCGQSLTISAHKKSSEHPNVFISHSHQQRGEAVYFMKLLKKHGAEIFLDQDNIQGGDNLPERILSGIRQCDILLLLWSNGAANSNWVELEIEEALRYEKRIIPYLIGQINIPIQLKSTLAIHQSDRKHANSALLKAIFGEKFAPLDLSQIFPGYWKAYVKTSGMQLAQYELELRINGQIKGVGGFSGTGGLGGLLQGLSRESGLSHLIPGMRFNIEGNWEYDENRGALILNVLLDIMGFQNTGKILLQTDGRNKNVFQGQCLNTGAIWELKRAS